MQDFFSAFTEVCQLVSEGKGQKAESDIVSLTAVNVKRITNLRGHAWNPLFSLALVRIARHLEVRGVSKLWSVGVDLFGSKYGDNEFSDSDSPVVSVACQQCRQAA